MKRLVLALGLWLGLIAPTFAIDPVTTPGDAAYTMLSTDVRVVTSALSAARTWTLPFAAASCIGQNCQPPAVVLEVIDSAGVITASNTLTLAPASGDTINGNAANIILAAAGARVVLFPISPNNWYAVTYNNYVTSAVGTASAVALTTTTGKDITTVSLSQGTWSCYGQLTRKLAATTSVTQLKTSISATLDTSGSLDTGTMSQFSTAANVMAADTTMDVGPVRLVLTATTVEHLVAQDTFTVSTNAGYGQLSCYQMK